MCPRCYVPLKEVSKEKDQREEVVELVCSICGFQKWTRKLRSFTKSGKKKHR